MPNKVLFGPEKIGSNSNLGVVKSSSWTGVKIENDGSLNTRRATEYYIKRGTDTNFPITSADVNSAAFYGLASAAGDSTQAASSNAMGIYTDNAKIAIQKMFGIYEPPFVLLNDITLDERTCIALTADSSGTPYNLIGIFMEIYYAANLVSEESGYGRYYFYNSNNKYMTAETGKYVTSTLPNYKLLEISKIGNLTKCDYTRITNTGNQGNWSMKTTIGNSNGGYQFDFGNITAIKMNTSDYEPIGTRIKIWGQWAY